MAITINGTGSITGLSAGGLPNDSVTSANIASLAASKLTGSVALATQVSGTLPDANAPSGSIIQATQTVKSDAIAMGTSGWTDISGLSASITPSSTSSKILVNCFIGCVSAGSNGIVLRIVRDGNAIGIGDSAGSRDRVTIRGMREGDANHNKWSPCFQYLDSPSSTSSVNYKIQIKTEGDSTAYINRAQTDTDLGNAYGGRSIAALILSEISG